MYCRFFELEVFFVVLLVRLFVSHAVISVIFQGLGLDRTRQVICEVGRNPKPTCAYSLVGCERISRRVTTMHWRVRATSSAFGACSTIPCVF